MIEVVAERLSQSSPQMARLRKAFEEADRPPYARIAAKMGVSDKTVSNILSGYTRHPSADKVDQMISILNEFRISTEVSDVRVHPDRTMADGIAVTMAIPGYRGVLAAGKFDEEPFFEEADAFEVPTAFLVGGTRNANLHVVIQVSGASMEPRIASGERIVVYMDPTPIPNGIMFVESPEGKKFLKTVRSQGDGTYGLASINQAGAKLKLAEGWTAIGYAVAIIGHGGAGVRNIEWDNGRPLRAA